MAKTSREYWAEWEERTQWERERTQSRRDKAALPQTKRKWREERPKSAKTDETWQQHFTGDPYDGGRPSAARAKIHAPIINKAVEKVKVADPKKKIAIITMGGPGSGKSSVGGQIADDAFVRCDPDNVKEQLPEWKEWTDPNDTWRGAAASMQGESSYVSGKIRDRAISEGKSLFIDGSGRDPEKMLSQIRNLKAEGYTVRIVAVHLPAEVGLQRAKLRSEDSGRYVPDDVVERIYEAVPISFRAVSKEVDHFKLYDNLGRPAKLVWSKKDGVETEDDPEFVARYKAL